MKTGLISLSLLAVMLLTGCDGGTKSIQWYMDHEKERDAKIEKCIKGTNPRGTEDCRNAIDASVHDDNAIQTSPNKIG